MNTTIHPPKPHQRGDLKVVYADYDTMAARYAQAIRALDLDEAEEARFLDLDRFESFRRSLERRLRKTKLWDYAPDRRDEVKAAREFLEAWMHARIPYGETVWIPEDERESFWADGSRQLGVESYALRPHRLEIERVSERVSQLSHELEDWVGARIIAPTQRVRHLGERAAEAVLPARLRDVRLLRA